MYILAVNRVSIKTTHDLVSNLSFHCRHCYSWCVLWPWCKSSCMWSIVHSQVYHAEQYCSPKSHGLFEGWSPNPNFCNFVKDSVNKWSIRCSMKHMLQTYTLIWLSSVVCHYKRHALTHTFCPECCTVVTHPHIKLSVEVMYSNNSEVPFLAHIHSRNSPTFL